MSVLIEDALPVVKFNGLNTNKNVDFSGATTVALPAGTTIAGVTAAGQTTITSTSANSLAVGPSGTSNPIFNVDSSTGSAVAGLNLIGATSAGTVSLTVSSSGSNASLTVDGKGTGTVGINTVATNSGLVTIGNATAVGGLMVNGPSSITSASATSFTVGRLGATTPAFQVASNTGTQVTGIKITGGAAAGTVAVAVQGGTNEKLTIDAQGSGQLSIGTTSTGTVVTNRGSLRALINGSTLTDLGTNQSSTPTAAQLLGGFLTQASAVGAGTVTTPNGTTISAAVVGVAVGDAFECSLANTGSQTLTLTGTTGATMVGTVAVPSGKNGVMRFINTGTNTWNIYCMVSA